MTRYVYCHVCPVTQRCFYVGRGIRERAYTEQRSPAWKAFVKHLPEPHEVQILHRTNDPKRAIELEAYEIQRFLKQGHPLVNVRIPGTFTRHRPVETEKVIGNFVKAQRLKLGLTQKQFAHKHKLDVKMIQRIEQHHPGLLLKNIWRVLRLFNAGLKIQTEYVENSK